jgi:hypothetical protein
MLSAAGRAGRLRRPRGGHRVFALLLLGAWAAAGVLWAAASPRPHRGRGCIAHAVPLVSTALHNAMLDAILLSGYVTMGIGTLLGGSVIMILTWVNVGIVVRGFGWPGIAVIAPAGLLELLGWNWSISLGLEPQTDCEGTRTSRARRAEREPAEPRPVRRAAQIAVVIGTAAVTEVLWTRSVGRSLVC